MKYLAIQQTQEEQLVKRNQTIKCTANQWYSLLFFSNANSLFYLSPNVKWSCLTFYQNIKLRNYVITSINYTEILTIVFQRVLSLLRRTSKFLTMSSTPRTCSSSRLFNPWPPRVTSRLNSYGNTTTTLWLTKVLNTRENGCTFQ